MTINRKTPMASAISTGKTVLRTACSCIAEEDIQELFALIDQAEQNLS